MMTEFAVINTIEVTDTNIMKHRYIVVLTRLNYKKSSLVQNRYFYFSQLSYSQKHSSISVGMRDMLVWDSELRTLK